MSLNALLSERKTAICDKWLDEVLRTYPADTSSFLHKRNNRFDNPVGYIIRESIETLLEKFVNGAESSELATPLEDIIRIRAVQDFSPSDGVSFVFSLKTVIREELGEALFNGLPKEEVVALESRIDDLVLLSFDIFMKLRERIYELKVNEAKRSVSFLLDRANEMYERRDRESAPATTTDA